ncbi:ROK family protein [Affinibrenneria salicis]|uniref:N-acetyl-D-glucosamine kinase n=1 Tax=Affinibrenneria salicis TaxID=2590031 RepID=A0A5J5FYT0_9GAMM|nr:ROK family protein [Affinibrenneria salicis]KAA8998224.1 ROK family protein [Affinibrenneria salicis]
MRYGFDIGGTKIEMAAYDARLNQLLCRRVSTPTDDYPAFLACIVGLVTQADRELDCRGSVGVGLPGITDPVSRRQLSVNVPCLNGRLLADDLARELARPVAIDNDCRCFALSEARTEQTGHLSVVFGAILGTGAGGGLVIDQQLHRGKNGLAGEWGHTPISARLALRYDLPLFDCSCGLSGCFERYVSGSGLLALSRHFGHHADSVPALIASYRQGDPLAQRLITIFVDILAGALAGLQLLLDVDAFVLGGGLSNVEELYRLLPPAMRGWLLPGAEPAAICAPVYGDSSGVRGAALLCPTRQ